AKPRTDLVRAVAGCDLRQEKIDAAKKDCPDLFYTTDYAEMLKRPDVDIVAIYTPDTFHGQHIVQAFEAGKDVICTKPLVNSVEDAHRVLEAAKRTGQQLLVGQSTRFFESFRRQRQAYERGEVGELELVDAHYIHRMDWYYEKSPWATQDTDWVYLGLSHPVDLIRWYLGPIEEVQALGTHSALARQYGVQSFDIYTVSVQAKSGQIGRIMGNYGLRELPSARNAIELVLYGSEGTSLAQYHDMRYYHTTPDGTEVKEDMLYSKRGYYFNNEVHGMHYGEFANYAAYFANALLNKQSYSPNLYEGLETYCIMEAIRQSAHMHKPVKVSDYVQEIGLSIT
ncbi:MAG: Gfo/Idh/MocA family oxidoreductase, partial [Anaerolineae bacterium]|nr:Gfo/Idh/MocA family oxidoreductase [Anaerolineae bacterium]